MPPPMSPPSPQRHLLCCFLPGADFQASGVTEGSPPPWPRLSPKDGGCPCPRLSPASPHPRGTVGDSGFPGGLWEERSRLDPWERSEKLISTGLRGTPAAPRHPPCALGQVPTLSGPGLPVYSVRGWAQNTRPPPLSGLDRHSPARLPGRTPDRQPSPTSPRLAFCPPDQAAGLVSF